MLLGFIILEGPNDFLQRKTPVNNGLQTIAPLPLESCPLDRLCCQLDPADTNLIYKQRRDCQLARQSQSRRGLGRYGRLCCTLLLTASGCRVRRPESHDQHRVRPSILCLLAPLRHGLVIDDVVGPESLSFSNFSSERRRSDYPARPQLSRTATRTAIHHQCQ